MKHFLLFLLVFITRPVLAQQTYTFTGNGYWTNAGNWSSNSIPPSMLTAGDTIYISPAPGDSCVLNTVQTIAAGASLIVTAGSNFIIAGGILNNPDSIYLDKILFIYTDSISSDTSDIWQYSYDDQKRVVRLQDSAPGYPGNPLPETYLYYYSDTASIPFKSMYLYADAVMNDTSISYYSYNSNRQRVSDTIYRYLRNADFSPAIYGIIRTIKQYDHAGSSIVGTSLDSLIYQENGNIDISNTSSRDTAWLDAGGNVSSNRRYNYFTNELSYSGEFTYDNHASPFARLSNFPARPVFPGDITLLWKFPQPHNMLSSDETSNDWPDHFVQQYLNYLYNSNGYPTEISIPDGQSTATTKIVFIYKAL